MKRLQDHRNHSLYPYRFLSKDGRVESPAASDSLFSFFIARLFFRLLLMLCQHLFDAAYDKEDQICDNMADAYNTYTNEGAYDDQVRQLPHCGRTYLPESHVP